MDFSSIINQAKQATSQQIAAKGKPSVCAIMKEFKAEAGDTYGTVNFEKVHEVLEEILFYANRQMVDFILSTPAGFKQQDGTYVLYGQTYQGLHDRYSQDTVPDILKPLYNVLAQKALAAIMTHLVEP